MASGPTPPAPCQSEVDTVADILDNFYLNTREESGSIEELEDVGLYNLYDHRTPKPNLSSPKPQYDQNSIKPIDYDKLAEMLKSYIDSTPCHNNIDSRQNVREEEEGYMASARTAKAGSEGSSTPTPGAGIDAGHPCSKN